MRDAKIEVVIGNIFTFEVDAIVHEVNESSQGRSLYDEMLYEAAGPELLEECKKIGMCPVGEARITKAYKLPCKHVIRAVAPISLWYGDATEDKCEMLRRVYYNSLVLANENKCATVAIPHFGNLAVFYPEIAVSIAVKEVLSFLHSPVNQSIQKVIVVCEHDWDVDYYDRALQDYLSPDSSPVNEALEAAKKAMNVATNMKQLKDEKAKLEKQMSHYSKNQHKIKIWFFAVLLLYFVLLALYFAGLENLRYVMGAVSVTCIIGGTLNLRQGVKISKTVTRIEETKQCIQKRENELREQVRLYEEIRKLKKPSENTSSEYWLWNLYKRARKYGGVPANMS